MKTIPVDVRHLEHAYGFDLHKFENGHIYPLSLLMNAMGFSKGVPQLKPRVKGKVVEE
jgi:hypothetical protein